MENALTTGIVTGKAETDEKEPNLVDGVFQAIVTTKYSLQIDFEHCASMFNRLTVIVDRETYDATSRGDAVRVARPTA